MSKGKKIKREKKNPSLPKTCHTYPTMMKLTAVTSYLKKIQNTYKSYKFWNEENDVMILAMILPKNN